MGQVNGTFRILVHQVLGLPERHPRGNCCYQVAHAKYIPFGRSIGYILITSTHCLPFLDHSICIRSSLLKFNGDQDITHGPASVGSLRDKTSAGGSGHVKGFLKEFEIYVSIPIVDHPVGGKNTPKIFRRTWRV